jgi:hypothetical protein
MYPVRLVESMVALPMGQVMAIRDRGYCNTQLRISTRKMIIIHLYFSTLNISSLHIIVK